MDADPTARVGFRDIYRAVGESEGRIVARLDSLVVTLNSTLSDHESRLRNIEQTAVLSASDALRLALDHEGRLSRIEGDKQDREVIVAERRRLLGLSNKALGIIVIGANAMTTVLVVVYNYITGMKP